MNTTRIALASLGGFVTYFVVGGLTAAPPLVRNEFLRYPAVYRPPEAMMKIMPAGMAAMFLAMVVLSVLYAMTYRGGSGLVAGARFGALIGVFSVCAFVVHNLVNLNIVRKLTLFSTVSCLLVWTAVGVAIGLIYRPKKTL
jgi:hypothetical protein